MCVDIEKPFLKCLGKYKESVIDNITLRKDKVGAVLILEMGLILKLQQGPLWALEGKWEETGAAETNVHIETLDLHPHGAQPQVCTGHSVYVRSPKHGSGDAHSLNLEPPQVPLVTGRVHGGGVFAQQNPINVNDKPADMHGCREDPPKRGAASGGRAAGAPQALPCAWRSSAVVSRGDTVPAGAGEQLHGGEGCCQRSGSDLSSGYVGKDTNGHYLSHVIKVFLKMQYFKNSCTSMPSYHLISISKPAITLKSL